MLLKTKVTEIGPSLRMGVFGGSKQGWLKKIIPPCPPPQSVKHIHTSQCFHCPPFQEFPPYIIPTLESSSILPNVSTIHHSKNFHLTSFQMFPPTITTIYLHRLSPPNNLSPPFPLYVTKITHVKLSGYFVVQWSIAIY